MRLIRAMLTDLREAVEFYTVPKKKDWLDPQEVARGAWKSYYQTKDFNSKVIFLADPAGTINRMPYNMQANITKAIAKQLLWHYEGDAENAAEAQADGPSQISAWDEAYAHAAMDLVAAQFHATLEPVASPKTGTAGFRVRLSLSINDIEQHAKRKAGLRPQTGENDTEFD